MTLGEANDMTGLVSVLEGLSPEDYIAFPDAEVCREGASTTHSVPVEEEVQAPDTPAAEGGVA